MTNTNRNTRKAIFDRVMAAVAARNPNMHTSFYDSKADNGHGYRFTFIDVNNLVNHFLSTRETMLIDLAYDNHADVDIFFLCVQCLPKRAVRGILENIDKYIDEQDADHYLEIVKICIDRLEMRK